MGALSAERPFPGLRPFTYVDHAYFFGREDQTGALYLMLDYSRFLAVVGSSGSGKSSLVQAGLLPLLDAERDDALGTDGTGRHWRWAEMRPGDSPLGHLADAIASLSDDPDDPEVDAIRSARRERILFTLGQSSFGIIEALAEIDGASDRSFLILVDQFEEVFRYSSSGGSDVSDARWREEAVQFVQLLMEASRSRERKVHIMLTMRSDFIGDCSQFYGLPEAVSASQYLVPSLIRDQREEAIRKPIEKAGAGIEPVLMERLLNDSGKEEDRLPVLQHCLSRIWAYAQRRCATDSSCVLSIVDYEAAGGLADALTVHAEEVMASLPELQPTVEQVFRALSEVDAEGRATRRVLRFDRLLAETGATEEKLRKVLNRFRADDCSFLIPSCQAAPELKVDSQVDVGHESLLRRWDRISAKPTETLVARGSLGGWLMSERRDGAIYRALLALIDNAVPGHMTTLPLDQVNTRLKWWESRPRTSAWAERYGGDIERVQALFHDSVAAQKAHVWRQRTVWGVFSALIAIVGAIFAYSYIQLVVGDNKATYERAMLMDQMTDMAADISANLRGTPGTSAAIQQMSAKAQSFSDDYANRKDATTKNHHGSTKTLSVSGLMGRRLSIMAAMLKSDQQMYEGNVTASLRTLDEQLDELNDVEKELKQSRAETGPKHWWQELKNIKNIFPHAPLARSDWISVTRADILTRRSLTQRLLNRLDQATSDLDKAEATLQSFIKTASTSLPTDSEDDRSLESNLIDKSWKKQAAIYASRIDLAIHFASTHVDNARTAYEQLTKLVKSQVPSQENSDNGNDCADISDQFWCSQRQIQLPALWADLKVAEKDYDAAIQSYTDIIGRIKKQLSDVNRKTTIPPWSIPSYQYRLGEALGLRDRETTDMADAKSQLVEASRYYNEQKTSENNAWVWIMDARIERDLTRFARAPTDSAQKANAFAVLKKDDEHLLSGDPNNPAFQSQLARDQQDLAEFNAGSKLPGQKLIAQKNKLAQP
jgi:hypothetical protein